MPRRLDRVIGFCGGPRRRPRRLRPRLLVEGRRAVRGSYYLRMFAITAGFHRYFSHRTYRPAPRAAVPAGLPRPDGGAEGRAVVGVQPPAPPPVLGPAGGHPQPASRAGSGGATSAGSSSPDHAKTDFSRVPDLAKYPELVWLDRHQYLPTAALRRRALPRLRAVGLFYGYFLSTVLLWHGTFSHQQRHAPLRPPRLRDDRRLAQQLPLLARDDGRGLAQQPPLGAGLRGPGLPLVGDRPELLPALARRAARPRARPAPPAAALARGRASTRTRTGRAFSSARLHVQVQTLTRRWAELRASARHTAHDAARRARGGADARGRRGSTTSTRRPPPSERARDSGSRRSTARSRRRARTLSRSSSAWSRPPSRCSAAGPAAGLDRDRTMPPLARIRALPTAWSGIRGGRLEVRLPDGAPRVFGDRAPISHAFVEIHDRRVFARFLLGGDIAFGETYAEGLWSSPDLSVVTRLAARNAARPSTPASRLPATLSTAGPSALRHCAAPQLRVAAAAATSAITTTSATDFYSLFLDPVADLLLRASSSRPGSRSRRRRSRKFDRDRREQLELSPGDRLLEIGTGWGAFAIHAATRYGCRVTTTTISRCAARLRPRAPRARGPRATGSSSSSRTTGRLSGRFDKAVSIEMFEAVGLAYYDDFFSAVDRLLEPGGAMLLQTIWMNEARFAALPPPARLHPAPHLPRQRARVARRDPQVARARDASMQSSPARGDRPPLRPTLAAWRERFLENATASAPSGSRKRFIRMWDYYLAYCEGGFAERYIGDAQLLLARPERVPAVRETGRGRVASARPRLPGVRRGRSLPPLADRRARSSSSSPRGSRRIRSR